MNHLLFRHSVPGSRPLEQNFQVSWTGTKVMGILNVTPDSFSGDGRVAGAEVDVEGVLEHAHTMLSAGAFILDVGGESTRPNATPVSANEELRRVIPIVKALSDSADALISIDTYKPEVAAAALAAGAHIVNDVSGLRDPDMLRVCAAAGAPAIIMHMQGTPQTMQVAPSYADVVADVSGYLNERAEAALAAGVPSVILDPGFGFGKTLAHNLELVRKWSDLTKLGHPTLLGASRKGTLGQLTGVSEAKERDAASLALHLYGAAQGAALVRVHNVPIHVQGLKVWQALDEV